MSLISGLTRAVTPGAVKKVSEVKRLASSFPSRAGESQGVQKATYAALEKVSSKLVKATPRHPITDKMFVAAASGLRSMGVTDARTAAREAVMFTVGPGKVKVATKGGTMIGGSLLRNLAKRFAKMPVKSTVKTTAAKVTSTAAESSATRAAVAPSAAAVKRTAAGTTAKLKTAANKNATLRQVAQTTKARASTVKTARATAKAKVANTRIARPASAIKKKATDSVRTAGRVVAEKTSAAAPAIRQTLAPSISGVKSLAKLTALGAGLSGGYVAAQAFSARQQASAREADINEAINEAVQNAIDEAFQNDDGYPYDGDDLLGILSEILAGKSYMDDGGVYYPFDGSYAMYDPNDAEAFDCGVDWINDSIANGGLVVFDGDEPLGIFDPETGEITGFSDDESEAVRDAIGTSPYVLALAGALLVAGGLYAVSDRFRNWVKGLVPGKKKNKWGMW